MTAITIGTLIGPFCTAYLHDTLIYSDNFKEHRHHMYLVLDAFPKVGLYVKPEKYVFHQWQVKYIGLIISTEGIKMDPKNFCTMHDWEYPSN
jgi:hypothetical protein